LAQDIAVIENEIKRAIVNNLISAFILEYFFYKSNGDKSNVFSVKQKPGFEILYELLKIRQF